MKVVLDTNVLISATLWDGSEAQKLLYKLIRADVEIYSTVEILNEFSKVLKRDFDYNEDEVVRVVNTLRKFLSVVKPKKHVSVIKDDPDDDKIIDCALEVGASIIISYDRHLLNIKNYQNIKMLKPEEVKI